MRATIIGAGVAGPVLGLFLRRLGVDVTIYEARTPERLALAGAFLAVAPNGMNVLEAAGVKARVMAAGDACHGFEFVNASGRTIARVDDRDDAQRYGSPLLVVRRTRLQRVLVDAALEAGVEVRHGAALVDVEPYDREVRATFESGEAVTSDFLVGCDGIRSQTRALVLPESPAPASLEQLDYGGFARLAEAPVEVGCNLMVFGRRAFFGAFRAADGELLWFHNGPKREDSLSERERLLEAHADDPPWINEVISRTPEILGPWPLHDIASIPRWSMGRIAVIGDAAHAVSPTSGQGASLAMEDAMMLARCLEATGDPERAFERLAQRRRARVEEVVRQSRRIGSTKVARTAFGAWLRDRMLPLVLPLGTAAQRRLYSYRVEVADPRAGG